MSEENDADLELLNEIEREAGLDETPNLDGVDETPERDHFPARKPTKTKTTTAKGTDLVKLGELETELMAKYPERGIVEFSLMPAEWEDNPFPGKQTLEITCEDCGAIRRIATQDLFQVSRCVACTKARQKAAKAAKRAESPEAISRKETRLALEEAKTLAFWTLEAAKIDAKQKKAAAEAELAAKRAELLAMRLAANA